MEDTSCLNGDNWWKGASPGYLSLDTSGVSRHPRFPFGVGEPDEDDLRRNRILLMHKARAVARAGRIRARREAEERYRAQRRQALSAIVGGLLVGILVVVVAGI